MVVIGGFAESLRGLLGFGEIEKLLPIDSANFPFVHELGAD
jgi:hypothetical protein